jgi:hypothetical protein
VRVCRASKTPVSGWRVVLVPWHKAGGEFDDRATKWAGGRIAEPGLIYVNARIEESAP